jgi:hypothetical protein
LEEVEAEKAAPRSGETAMNQWIILHDDGSTPKIHHKIVEASTMTEAIEKSGVPGPYVFGCALLGHEGVVGTLLLRTKNQREAVPGATADR